MSFCLWRIERASELSFALTFAVTESYARPRAKSSFLQGKNERVQHHKVFSKTKKDTDGVLFCFGGEKEIRTLVGVLAQTRFPVVRLRPTQPSLRADLGILSQNYPFVKSFFLFCLKTSENIPVLRRKTADFSLFSVKALDKGRNRRYNTLNR